MKPLPFDLLELSVSFLDVCPTARTDAFKLLDVTLEALLPL